MERKKIAGNRRRNCVTSSDIGNDWKNEKKKNRKEEEEEALKWSFTEAAHISLHN